MIHVHTWLTLLPGLQDFGHASMTIDKSNRNPAEYVSWWPIGTATPGEAMTGVTAKTQTYAEDCKSEGREPDVTISIDGLYEYGMYRSWKFLKENGKYSLFHSACTHTVVETLVQGGANLSLIPRLQYEITFIWAPRGVKWYAQLIESNIEDIKKNLKEQWETSVGETAQRAYMHKANTFANIPIQRRSGLGQMARRDA